MELPIVAMTAIPSAPGRYFIASNLTVGKINSGNPLGTLPIKSNPYFSNSNS